MQLQVNSTILPLGVLKIRPKMEFMTISMDFAKFVNLFTAAKKPQNKHLKNTNCTLLSF